MIRSSTYLGVRAAALARDHLAEQREREVRVVVLLARLRDELERGHRGDELVLRRRLAGDEHLPRFALQARQVGEHPPDGRRAVRDPVDVLFEAVVEVELTGGAQLHDRDGGERLRDRADAVLRIGRRLAVVAEVGRADRVRPDDLAVSHDRRRNAREPVGLALREEPVERLRRGHAFRGRRVRAPARVRRRRR